MSSKKLLWIIPLSLLASCAGSNREYNKADASSAPAAMERSSTADSLSAADEDEPLNSPHRKIIRKADFICQVQNVFTATTRMEQLVKSLGGVVQESNLNNRDVETKTAYYTHDSLRQTRIYTTTSTLTLRVPSQYLDSVINAIPGLCTFIDSRTLAQSDVTWHYLSNELKNVADNDHTASDRAMGLAKKSRDPIEVQKYADQRQEKAIDRQMENLGMLDDVHYATVTVALTQPMQVATRTTINTDYIARAPFSLECKEALTGGWQAIRSFTVVLISIWPLLILLALGWFGFRKLTGRKYALAKR